MIYDHRQQRTKVNSDVNSIKETCHKLLKSSLETNWPLIRCRSCKMAHRRWHWPSQPEPGWKGECLELFVTISIWQGLQQTNLWPQADTIVKMKDKALIISLQKSSFTTNISSVVLHDFWWEKAGTSQGLHSVILGKKLKVHLFRPIIWEGISNHTQCQSSIFTSTFCRYRLTSSSLQTHERK